MGHPISHGVNTLMSITEIQWNWFPNVKWTNADLKQVKSLISVSTKSFHINKFNINSQKNT